VGRKGLDGEVLVGVNEWLVEVKMKKVGEYRGLVGEYPGDVRLSAGDVGEYAGEVGLLKRL
jgi:hypothetical protein